jgi:hypothetical protein
VVGAVNMLDSTQAAIFLCPCVFLVCPCALQASIWDVDGTGMQQVPSAELDLALRKVGTCQYGAALHFSFTT